MKLQVPKSAGSCISSMHNREKHIVPTNLKNPCIFVFLRRGARLMQHAASLLSNFGTFRLQGAKRNSDLDRLELSHAEFSVGRSATSDLA